MLNGANSRMVSHITGKSVREEASKYTRTVDIVRRIRARRLKWLGHILRMDDQRMVHQAVKFMADHRSAGDLLMNVPAKYSWPELKQLAANRDYWRSRVSAVREGTGVSVTIHGPPPSPCKRRSSKHSNNPTTRSTKPKLSPASKTAKRYHEREAHEAFFRPSTASPCERNRLCKSARQKCHKTRMLTDKERREAAREHWDLNHGMPEILGHTAQQQTHHNMTMVSIQFQYPKSKSFKTKQKKTYSKKEN